MASAICTALGGALVSAGGAHPASASPKARHAAVVWLGGQVAAYQHDTWYWEHVMGVTATKTAGRVLTEMSVGDLRRAVALWHRRAHAARIRAHHPPHLRDWLCIHHFEGSWTDHGSPYWGGLQMSLGFQQMYGGWLYAHKGTADHWTPLEQMWTAERALLSRGFWPWPNTARFCGLI